MDEWLIRTSQNWIAGPYKKAQVIQMVLEGKLELEDEICPANGYWVSVHERDEIRGLLGIEVPRRKDEAEDETTQAALDVTAETTNPVLEQPRSPGEVPSVEALLGPSLTAPRASGRSQTATKPATPPISSSGPARASQIPQNQAASPVQRPVGGRVVRVEEEERVSWVGKLAAWTLILLAGLLFAYLFARLKL